MNVRTERDQERRVSVAEQEQKEEEMPYQEPEDDPYFEEVRHEGKDEDEEEEIEEPHEDESDEEEHDDEEDEEADEEMGHEGLEFAPRGATPARPPGQQLHIAPPQPGGPRQSGNPLPGPSPQKREMNKDYQDVAKTGRWGTITRGEMIIAGGILLAIIGGIVAAIVVLTLPDGKPEDSTPAPTPAPTPRPDADPADQLAAMLQILREDPIVSARGLDHLSDEVKFYDTVDYTNETIPAGTRAMKWLLEDPWHPQPDDPMLSYRYALATLYFSTKGDSWVDHQNWLSKANACDWYGMTCNPVKESVWAFDLTRNNLDGPFPVEVHLIQGLRSIVVTDNKLTGDVPWDALGDLPSLSILYMNENYLSGEWSEAVIANNVLSTFFMQQNLIVGRWPRYMCPMAGEDPIFDDFAIDCLDETRCLCCDPGNNCYDDTRMREVRLAAMLEILSQDEVIDSSGLGDDISFYVDVDIANEATAANIRAMTWLLSDPWNPFPPDPWLQFRYALATLYFSTMGVSWMEDWSWLSQYHACEWYGNSCDKNSTTIWGIQLPMNNLTGPIPAEISLLQDIRTIAMEGNQLSGDVPWVALGSLPSLSTLNLSNNTLTGQWNEALVANNVLSTLHMQQNSITGVWPTAFCPSSGPVFDNFMIDCLAETQCSCCATGNCYVEAPVATTPPQGNTTSLGGNTTTSV